MSWANLAGASTKCHLYDARRCQIGFADGLVGGEETLPTLSLGVEKNRPGQLG